MENDNKIMNTNMRMDVKTAFAAIRRIEDSDDYRHANPAALRQKEQIEEQISKWVWK